MTSPERPGPRLELSRAQILAHRRRAGALDERLPPGPGSLRRAAWAGLPDSMPRAALVAIHARVAGTTPSTWEDPSLVQLWGPRFSAYVVPADDIAVFTLGRFPADARGARVATETAARLQAFLGDRRMRYGDAGQAMGVHGNSLRYAAPTGTVLLRWEGARQPVIWTVPAPTMSVDEARLELARRYLHVLGPTNPTSLWRWAGSSRREAHAAIESLGHELVPVRTPIGDGWILASDEASFRAPVQPAEAVRLLPSGDTHVLLHGIDRELLVPDAMRRTELWTSRVWPGALLIDGEVVGTWRRADADLTVQAWRALSPAEREAVDAEAASLPLVGLPGPIRARWTA